MVSPVAARPGHSSLSSFSSCDDLILSFIIFQAILIVILPMTLLACINRVDARQEDHAVKAL